MARLDYIVMWYDLALQIKAIRESGTLEDSARVTRLLHEIEGGNHTVVNELLPLLYQELKQIADRQLRRERRNHTLNTTALVHEAYFKLVDQNNVSWQNRAHFFGIAARAMREVLVDYARRRASLKRGGGWQRLQLDERIRGGAVSQAELLDLDDALTRLSEMDERMARVVELRVFGGLLTKEVAHVLKVSRRTVERDWRVAKMWLGREFAEGGHT